VIVDLYVQCGEKGIEVCRHKPTADTLRLRALPAATLARSPGIDHLGEVGATNQEVRIRLGAADHGRTRPRALAPDDAAVV